MIAQANASASLPGSCVYHVIKGDVSNIGICSPESIYKADRDLFMRTSYRIYQGRCAEDMHKTNPTPEDVIYWLNHYRLPCTAKCIFFAFADVHSLGIEYKSPVTEFVIPIPVLKEYATNQPILFLGKTQTKVSWKVFETHLDKYHKEAIKGSREHNDTIFRYMYIKHFAVECNPIPLNKVTRLS